MDYKEHKIDYIEEGSIAEELGIEPGDCLLAINGKKINDVLDYHYLVHDEKLSVLILKADGQEWELDIEKDYYDDLGIVFENGMMDEYKSCCNKCIFCFIDQMPPNMRETLYFKDDDARLSFLQGNYITLTNMKEEDVERIIRYKMSPINVSVHTTDPELRCKMLNNRFAGLALKKLKRFYDAQIEMNGQIVLCKGVNDGAALEKSIRDLTEYLPFMQSVSVVPVGLTKYREGLYPMDPFRKEDAKAVLSMIHRWQDICYEKYQNHFIHASDEWYFLAEEDFPSEQRYDGYPQLENGVGMVRLLQTEFDDCLETEEEEQFAPPKFSLKSFLQKKPVMPERTRHEVSVVTGRLAAPLLRKLSAQFSCRHPEVTVHVHEIENRFFGEMITVSGLLTGQDIKEQLSGKPLGEKVLLPCNLMRSGEEVFLDDMSRLELENSLQVPVHIVKSDGQCLYEELLCRTND